MPRLQTFRIKGKIPTTDNDRIINQNITATAEDRQETCFNEISYKVKLRQVPNRYLSCNKRRGPVLREYEKEYYLLITTQPKRSSLKRFFFASGNRNCFTSSSIDWTASKALVTSYLYS